MASLLPGLPPYGPPATPVPAAWGGWREGVVVSFGAWTANVQPGIGGLTGVMPHPDGVRVLVLACGDAWVIDAVSQEAACVATAVDAVLAVPGSADLVLSEQGLCMCRLGPDGVVWRTRRLAWDGLRGLAVDGDAIVGEAWDLPDLWVAVSVTLATGEATGGARAFSGEDRVDAPA